MIRTLYLDPCPFAGLGLWSGQEFISPNRSTTRTLRVVSRRSSRTLEDVAHQVLRERALGLAPVLISHRLLREAAWEVLGTADPEGTARSLMATLRSIFQTGADLDILEQTGSPRICRLAQLAKTYRAKLRAKGLVDKAEALAEAARLGPERRAIMVYGYPWLVSDERAFVDALAGDGSVLILPGADHPIFAENTETARVLQARGWQIIQSEAKPRSPGEVLSQRLLKTNAIPEGIRAHSYPHLDAEIRGVLSQVKELLVAGISPGDIVLVTRDETLYGPSVLAVAWEYGLHVRARYNMAIQETRMGGWIQLLLEVIVQGIPFESTARLLSHPLGPGLSAEEWRAARRNHPSNRQDWQAIGIDLSHLVWPAKDKRARWVDRLQELLDGFKLRGQAGRVVRDIVAVNKIQREGLPALAEPLDEILERADFVQEVLDSLSLLTVPVQPGRGGVELLSPLLLYGGRYRHVFVLGMAEGVLPAPVQDDPVLDFHERKRLADKGIKLDQAAEMARREHLSFYSLLQSATGNLTLSCARLLRNQEALASPYFSMLDLLPTDPPLLPAASPEEARRICLRHERVLDDPVLLHARHAWDVEQRRELAGHYDEYDGIVHRALDPSRLVFSASQLLALGQCPFRWFAGQVLKLAEPEEAETDLSVLLCGNLYHKTLELAVSWARGAPDLRQGVLKHLEEAFLQAEKDLGFPVIPAWPIRRREHLAILRQAVQGEDFLREGTQVLSTETRFYGRWHGLAVTGIVDRADRTPEGLVLVDYKTRASRPMGAKDPEGKLTLDVQLPLYLQAAAPVLYPHDTACDAYYYSLTAAKTLPVQIDEEGLVRLAEEVKQRLQQGWYPVQPDAQLRVCKTCPYDAVCRQGPRLNRKGMTYVPDA